MTYAKRKDPEVLRLMKEKCAALGGRIAATAQVDASLGFDGPINVADNVVICEAVKIGALSYLNVGTVVFPRSEIGRYCSIARNVQIGLAKHPVKFLSTHPFQFSQALFAVVPGYTKLQTARWTFHEPTKVGNDVWIGAGALVMSGVTVNTGAVIGAGAVVTRDVGAYDIVAGVPARKIGSRFKAEVVERLLKSAWWELSYDELATIEFSDAEAALTRIEFLRVP